MGDRSGNSRAASFLSFFTGNQFLIASREVSNVLESLPDDSISTCPSHEVGVFTDFSFDVRQLAIDSVVELSFSRFDCRICVTFNSD